MPERFYITLVGRQMFLLFVITLFCLRLPLFKCYFIEISLNDDNASNSLKLTCGPRTENLELESNHRVLWQSSQFGHDEHQELSEMLPTDALVPNISISSSERYACYLIARKDSSYVLNSQRRLVLRDSLGSIPAEDAVCRPGYRSDGDRCYPYFPGSYTSGQDAECSLCPKDFYVTEEAADSYLRCPEGKKTVAQGADSLESCVYFDQSEHPVKPETPPWVLTLYLIGIIILCVWIIIIIILIRHFSAMRRVDAEQTHRPSTRDQREIPRESCSGQFAVRVKKSSDQHEVPVKTDEKVEDLIEIPKPKDSENLYDSIDDDAQYVPDKQKSDTDTVTEKHGSETCGTGLKPEACLASSTHHKMCRCRDCAKGLPFFYKY